MTREEIIHEYEAVVAAHATAAALGIKGVEKSYELFRAGLSALRPVSREQVEKVWMGEWERITNPYGKIEGFLCKCGTQTYSASNFCPHCGGAKTDKAVQMVMERLEVLHENP